VFLKHVVYSPVSDLTILYMDEPQEQLAFHIIHGENPQAVFLFWKFFNGGEYKIW